MTMVCYKCKQTKNVDAFSLSWRRRKTGRCRDCELQYLHEKRARNPEQYRLYSLKNNRRRRAIPEVRAKMNASVNRRHHELKAAAFHMLGDMCACCGETHPAFLQIDHINNDGAEHRKSLGISRGNTVMPLYREVRDGKIDGLQLLCANCNWGKARNQGVCPHQEERARVLRAVS